MVKVVWNGHFINISVEIWVQCLNVYGLFGLPGNLGGILINYVKLEMEGKGWWKSVQCLSMAEVEDLQCSLTLSPRALDVSLT